MDGVQQTQKSDQQGNINKNIVILQDRDRPQGNINKKEKPDFPKSRPPARQQQQKGNPKRCIDMTQNEFIAVVLRHFNEHNIKKNSHIDIEKVRQILVFENIDYIKFMNMERYAFCKLLHHKLSIPITNWTNCGYS